MKTERGWMHHKPKGNSLPTFIRETLYDRPTSTTQVEVVIRPAAEDDAREELVRAVFAQAAGTEEAEGLNEHVLDCLHRIKALDALEGEG